MSISHLLLLLQLIGFITAFIPAPCVHNVTKRPHVCCPVPAGFSQPCGFPTRGACLPATAYKAAKRLAGFKLTYRYDIRVDWPSRLFKHTCQCVGSFSGFDCGGCRVGFEGTNCQHRTVYTRRNILTYSSAERSRWLRVLEASRRITSNLVRPTKLAPGYLKSFRNMSVHESLVSIHYFGYTFAFLIKGSEKVGVRVCSSVDMNHGGSNFILWHRYLLLLWERELRQIAERLFGWGNFTIPYWDYTDANTCEICTSDFLCKVSSRSDGKLSHCPLSNWISHCKYQDCNNCDSEENMVLTRALNAKIARSRRRRNKTLFPTSREMLYGLLSSEYGGSVCKGKGFGAYIESGAQAGIYMHNLVHDMFTGDMETTASSPNDPLFLFHHSQLDRLLDRWIRMAKPTASQIPLFDPKKPQVCRHCALVGFFPPVTSADMLTDLRNLGATYDSFTFGRISESSAIQPLRNASAYERLVCGRQSKSADVVKSEGGDEEKELDDDNDDDDDDGGMDVELEML